MHVAPEDRDIVKWAVDRGLIFGYESDQVPGEPCLKLHLGLLTAAFRRGKLTHLSAATEARHIDHLMRDLTELFALCAQTDAYPDGCGPSGAPITFPNRPNHDDDTLPERLRRRLTG